jgi:creatinine amidohydrolase
MPEFSKAELAELFPSGFAGWDTEHASHLETSLMWVLRPDLVRVDRIADDQAKRHPAWDVVPAPADFMPATGVLMNPSDFSEAAGKRFLQAAAGQLVAAITTEFGSG